MWDGVQLCQLVSLHGVVMGQSIWSKCALWTAVVAAWWVAWGVPFKTAPSVTVGIVVGLWPGWNVSYVWDHNKWSVICSFRLWVYQCLKGDLSWWHVVFLREESCWGTPVQRCPKFITVITLGIWGSGSPKWPVHPQTKHLSLSGHHTDWWKGVSVAVRWCASLSF